MNLSVSLSKPQIALSLIRAEKARRNIQADSEDGWQDWLTGLFPAYFASFAPHHAEFWEWVWSVELGEKVPAWVGIWARGDGKSTGAEGAAVALGARKKRRYCWYVRAIQDNADDSVSNIAAMLESQDFAEKYPMMAQRKVGKYGASQGWRRNRLRTASGYTIDALGLDKKARGVKIEETRPDLIIFDDIDEPSDTPATVQKKIETITKKILPAGALDGSTAVIFIQNLISPDGVAAQLVDGRADFLRDRIISGPHPAVKGLAYEQRSDGKFYITGGEPLWDRRTLEICQSQMNEWGLTAFLVEAQHMVERTGGMYDHIEFRHCAFSDVPDLVRTTVWVDPAVTTTDNSDNHGIQVDGIAGDDTIYRLFSWEGKTTPEDVIRRGVFKAIEHHSSTLGVETDQGGDTWKTVFDWVIRDMVESGEITQMQAPMFIEDKAGAGHGSKVHRGQQMLADYERGKIVHVMGTHDILERSLRRFPNKPLDLADAAWWAWNDLRSRLKASSLFAFVGGAK